MEFELAPLFLRQLLVKKESLDGARSMRDNFWTAHCCYLFSFILDFIHLLWGFFQECNSFLFSPFLSLFFSHSVFIGPINIIIFFSKKWQIISFLTNVIRELMLIFEIMLIFLKKNKMRVQVSHLFFFKKKFIFTLSCHQPFVHLWWMAPTNYSEIMLKTENQPKSWINALNNVLCPVSTDPS